MSFVAIEEFNRLLTSGVIRIQLLKQITFLKSRNINVFHLVSKTKILKFLFFRISLSKFLQF